MITKQKPNNFNPKFEVSICFCENDGKYLMLKRNSDKMEGGKWGPPGGKLGSKETSLDAIQREVEEETGLYFPKSAFVFYADYYVKYPDTDFVCSVFSVETEDMEIRLNTDEHNDFQWIKPLDSLKLEQVLEQDAVVKDYFELKGNL